MVPNGGGRYASPAAVPSVEYSAVNESNQISSLIYDGDAEFQYDQFSSEQKYQQQQEQNLYKPQQNFDHFGRLFEQTMERPVNFGMLGNTSESFAAAFSLTNKNSSKSTDVSVYNPSFPLDAIIYTYENNAKVIYGKIPPKGSQLNVVL
jgi:hypothetical protein